MELLLNSIKMDWPVLLPILVCSILVVGVVINRFSFYKKNKKKSRPGGGWGGPAVRFFLYCSRMALSRMRFVTLASRMLYSTAAANASS